MYKKLYRVTFITKKGGTKTWAIDMEADNQKEAKSKAIELWRESNTDHMFHITINRLADDEEFLYHYFTRTKWI